VKWTLVPGSALVTGGARGIGLSIVSALAEAGANVAVVDVRHDDEAARAAVEKHGRRFLFLERDVRDFAGAESAVRETEAALGPLGMLVANAGITRDRASWKLTEDDWRSVIDVNLTGEFAYARAAAIVLREHGRGRIVLISSINALRGKFGQANYAASKAGLVALGKTLARELGPKGITVNVVAPGFIRTSMTAALDPAILERAREETALGHLGEPEDVAALVAFLCSEAARHVTGDVIRVDGGQAM
jgi:3-oxoacyl-[acyl-carrier protein] reductase